MILSIVQERHFFNLLCLFLIFLSIFRKFYDGTHYSWFLVRETELCARINSFSSTTSEPNSSPFSVSFQVSEDSSRPNVNEGSFSRTRHRLVKRPENHVCTSHLTFQNLNIEIPRLDQTCYCVFSRDTAVWKGKRLIKVLSSLFYNLVKFWFYCNE